MANAKMDSSCIKGNGDLSKSSKWDAKYEAEQVRREKIYQDATEQLINDLFPDVELSDIQRSQFRDLAKLSIGKDGKLESLRKLHIGDNGKLESIAQSPHITSNWGQYQENPNLFLGIVQACKLVGIAEMLEDGAEINTRYGSTYLEGHPKLEKAFARMGQLHLGLSVLLNINAVHTLIKAEGKVHSFNGGFALTTRLSDLGGDVTDILDGWRNLPSMKKYTLGFKHWGTLAIGFSLIEGVAKNAVSLRSLLDKDSPLVLRALGSIQAGVGAAGSVTNAIAMKMIMDKVAAGKKAVTPSLRNALIISALCEFATMPLDIYSIHMQSEYADKNDELDKKFKEHGYNGYGLLRDVYKDKVKLDAALLTLRTSITAVHLSTSVALKASGIGLPAALAIDAVAMVASAIIDLVEQPILDQIAKAQLDKILQWEALNPGKNYFSNALDAHYMERLDEIATVAHHIQGRWGLDQVIAITQRLSNDQIRELATIVGRTGDIQSGKIYADAFKDGLSLEEKSMELNAGTGSIELNKNDVTQALIFTSPILVPGKETKIITNDGAKKYTFWEKLWQNLVWSASGPSASGTNQALTDAFEKAGHYDQKQKLSVSPTNWQINDKGTANTKFSFSNLVQRIQLRDGTLKKIDIEVNMGAGNDLATAPLGGKLIVDGGIGDDTVSYSNFQAPIHVIANAEGSYTVEKKLKDAKVFKESISTQTINFGKKTTTVEYRAITEHVVNEDIIDALTNIEKIIGGQGNDQMSAENASWTIDFDGGGGNDTIITGTGNDIIRGGKGSDTIKARGGDDAIFQDITKGDNDYICGGDGNDTIYYNVTKPAILGGNNGIYVNLKDEKVIKILNNVFSRQEIKAQNSAGTVVDTMRNIHAGEDTVKNIENIVATEGWDTINMDDNNNIVHALGGDDIIKTFDGDDTIDAGRGDDIIDAGKGNDYIFQTLEKEKDQIDGGQGQDTLSYYEQTNFKNSKPHYNDNMHIDSVGIRADLIAGIVIKFSKKRSVFNDDDSTKLTLPKSSHVIYDQISNIENMEGTDLNDMIFGSQEANVIRTYAGNDQINARGGNDLIDVGAGDDLVYAGSGDDEINAGVGNDIIFGGDGDDLFQQMDDHGQDDFDGGNGLDMINYSKLLPDRHVIVDLLNAYAEKHFKKADGTTTHVKDKLKHIEGVVGTQGNDHLFGDDEDNLLDGMNGDNLIQGRGGNDRLRGGKGNDTYQFAVGDGHDHIEDRGGDADRVSFTASLDQYTLNKKGYNLIIIGNNNRDSVTVSGHFLNDFNKLEYISWNSKDYNVNSLINNAAVLPGGIGVDWSFGVQTLLS